MILKERIQLTPNLKKNIEKELIDIQLELTKKYPLAFIISLILIEFLLSIGIYFSEDNYFWVPLFLKLMTIIPIWAIISITYKSLSLRNNSNKFNKLYRQLLEENSYETLRVKIKLCYKYNDGLHYYFLFETTNEGLILNLNDFTINTDKFPNDDFIIPPYPFFDILGNAIITNGNEIDAIENREKISNYLSEFSRCQKGQVLIKKI